MALLRVGATVLEARASGRGCGALFVGFVFVVRYGTLQRHCAGAYGGR